LIDFTHQEINSWQDFLNLPHLTQDTWIFRGQSGDWPLKTSFERACERSAISLRHARKLEKSLLDNFRRRYDGNDREFVINDTLYCLALMEHHGAPTRLLDWTYSPYIALYFALENSIDGSVIWCMNHQWWMKAAKAIVGPERYEQRNRYETRNDQTFLPLYMTEKPFKMVYLENPFFFNSRLNIQQGVFLCNGDITASFEENLKALGACSHYEGVVKIHCRMTMDERLEALKELHKMNIHRESLFPGLDGFAQALGHRLRMYLELYS
jgi:hypothetical protein